jgi:L-ascorbate metabolism protein UlaG (beta-lactamase superfamily)
MLNQEDLVTELIAPSNDPDFLASVRRATVQPGEIALWYTGGAGYVVRTSEATLLIDPFIGPSNPPDWIRAIPPAFAPEQLSDLGRLDAVVLTHEHGDHADPDALGPLGQRTTAAVIGPAACIAVAREAGTPEDRLHVLAHEATKTIGDLRVTAVPMNDPGAPGCNGYVLETGDVAVLHCGDSLYFPGFLELGRRWSFDAICLSVGANPPGRNFYLDESGAARAARDAGARRLIVQHHDLWQGITLDPRRVAVAAQWYCPETHVIPAVFQEQITVMTQSGS